MSASFYSRVSQFFQLLDLDGDGRVDRGEARLGFTACFSAVHRHPEASENKEALLTQQVDWLFAAASAAAVDSAEATTAGGGESIDEVAFKACYQKLLSAAYEEEVLALDLSRAIDALQASDEWQAARAVFVGVRDLYATSIDGAAALTQANPKHRHVREVLFAPITGRSNVLGPRAQTKARKIVAPLVDPTAPDLTLEQLIVVVKALMAAQIPSDLLQKSVEDAIAVAHDATPAASASSSSTPAAAQ